MGTFIKKKHWVFTLKLPGEKNLSLSPRLCERKEISGRAGPFRSPRIHLFNSQELHFVCVWSFGKRGETKRSDEKQLDDEVRALRSSVGRIANELVGRNVGHTPKLIYWRTTTVTAGPSAAKVSENVSWWGGGAIVIESLQLVWFCL